MVWFDFIAVFFIVLIAVAVLAAVSGGRYGEGWGAVLWLFAVLFLDTWALGAWMQPLGPPLWGTFWLPFLIVAVLIEELDLRISRIAGRRPDVLMVTGDHSTPNRSRNHSWHPVPVLLASPTCRPDMVERFGEAPCMQGVLGRLEAKYLMPLALAHARRLEKFGA